MLFNGTLKNSSLHAPSISRPRGKQLAKVKASDSGVLGGAGKNRIMPHTGPRAKTFRETNLVELGLPAEAMPLKNVTYKGMKGYTLYSANGAVTPHTK